MCRYKSYFVDKEQLTDLSYLRDVAMGDDDIVIETTEAFLEDTPSAIHDLQEYFVDQEWESLHKQAHKMKPSLKYMGMDRALDLILTIEDQAKSGNISEDLGAKVQKFTSLCKQALDELSKKIERMKTGEA